MKRQNPHSETEAIVVSFESARKRIQPPTDLTADELSIFKDVIRRHAPSHFAESDKPLVTMYCMAVRLSRLYAEHNHSDVAREMCLQTAKLVSILANRLKLASG